MLTHADWLQQTFTRQAHDAAAREKTALDNFERRLRALSEASRQMIDAVVELRDARAARTF